MRNLDWLVYTYRHRRAFEYCVQKRIQDPRLRAELLERARIHDMDKMVMYLFMDQQKAQLMHIQTQPHHLENNLPRTYMDLVETVIDYECAPYTKPDKPLNAYEFVLKLMDVAVLERAVGEKLIEIMRKLDIARPRTIVEDAEGLAYCASIGPVSEEILLAEILQYIDENRDNSLRLALEHMEM